MSLYDRFHVNCPECGADVAFQSKAMLQPCSRDYNISNVPEVILAGLNLTYEECPKCGHKVMIISKTKGYVR